MRRLLLAVLLVAAGAGGCGGNGHVAQRDPAKASPTPALGRVSDTSRLVTVGDGRSLFLDCIGSGSPTIVLEAGFGGNTHDWDAVQPGLSETTRTCAYDRAGIGNSVAGKGVRDAAGEIDDLAHLLAAAHIDPPYVLVGHSYGGLLVRLFAQAHAQDTAGIVLVDSMGRDQTRRTMAIWPKSQFRKLRRELAKPVREGVDLAAGEALAARIPTLHDTPLVVVTAGSETFGGARRASPARSAGSGRGCRTSSPLCPATTCTSWPSTVTTSSRDRKVSRTSSSAPSGRSSTPPATTRRLRPARGCSPAVASAAAIEGRAH